MFNLKFFFETLDIVKETPLIEMEALLSRNLNNFLLFNSKINIQDLSIILIFTLAVVSTCPCIKFPDIS